MPYFNSKTSPISQLVGLVWNASRDDSGGIRNEGGRLIINLIKIIHRTKATEYIKTIMNLNSITLVVQTLTGAFLTKQLTQLEDLFVDHHVHFDAPAEGSKVFPQVQNESIVALTLLVSSIFV